MVSIVLKFCTQGWTVAKKFVLLGKDPLLEAAVGFSHPSSPLTNIFYAHYLEVSWLHNSSTVVTFCLSAQPVLTVLAVFSHRKPVCYLVYVANIISKLSSLQTSFTGYFLCLCTNTNTSSNSWRKIYYIHICIIV